MATTCTGGTVAAAVLAIAAGLGAVSIAEAQTVPQALPAVTRRVVISIPDRTLTLFENDAPVHVYPVAVGAPKTPSPVGRFTIINRIANPNYYRPGKVIGPGPSNPLGSRWLGLDARSYGIHGTDDPSSIGYARSHGCIRMRKHDVEELFGLLRVGDVVELRSVSDAALKRCATQNGEHRVDAISLCEPDAELKRCATQNRGAALQGCVPTVTN